MKRLTSTLAGVFACMALATGALAADPLKNVDDALSSSTATVDKASKNLISTNLPQARA